MNGIQLGSSWAKYKTFSDVLLRGIISNELKSLSDGGLMLNLAQMYPKLIPNVSQLLPKRINGFFGVFEVVCQRNLPNIFDVVLKIKLLDLECCN
jgi:hypothetical protein